MRSQPPDTLLLLAKYPRQRGFSLLEVLVAFAILSLSLGVLLQAFSGGLRNAALSDEYTQATLYAESILAALGRETPLTEGTEEGRIAEDFVWRTIITPYQEPSLPANEFSWQAYRIRVEILWRAGGRSLALETLRLATADNL